MTKKLAAELYTIATNEEFSPRQRKELLHIALQNAVANAKRTRPPSR